VSDNLDEFMMFSQGRIAAGDLNICPRSIGRANLIKAIEDLFERGILNELRVLGQITQRAVQIAPLRDLNCRTANGKRASEHLIGREDPSHSITGGPPRRNGIVSDSAFSHCLGLMCSGYRVDRGFWVIMTTQILPSNQTGSIPAKAAATQQYLYFISPAPG
jgi:hypothetical protein